MSVQSVNELSAYKMSINEMSVAKMSLDEMPPCLQKWIFGGKLVGRT